jgi:lysylphosphatidylglycerol synthetase-like protein (DUF2156 family)
MNPITSVVSIEQRLQPGSLIIVTNEENERILMMNWITMVGGAALFLAPFISSYTSTPAALWTSLIMGVVIAVLGYTKKHKWAAIAGLLTVVTPWVFGFSGVSAALWNCVIIGGVITIADGYQGFFKESGTRKTRHA